MMFGQVSEQVLVAWIGQAGLVITALVTLGITVMKSRKIRIAERGLEMEAQGLGLANCSRDWGSLIHELSELCRETAIDRFLILKAWNGVLDPRFATAVFQFRRGGNEEPVSYVHVELDTDYVTRLRSLVGGDLVAFNVAELGDCLIKDIYQAEGVVSSCWAHIETHPKENGSAEITYCSFASHVGPIDPVTQTKCRLLLGKLREMAANFRSQGGSN